MPLRNVRVWRRRDRIASTSRARTSSSVVPSSGKSPSRPSRRSSCSRSFSACLSPVRTRAWSSRARCRNRRRTYWERHSSFLFFSPYFFRSSFSALMRSASHGWDGRSNFARENFGSPNDSLLLLRRRLLLFLLFFFLGGGFLRLVSLRGLEGGLLRHPDRQARAAVRPGALPADLLAGLVAHAFVRPDHLHQIDVVPQPDFDLRTDQVQLEPRPGPCSASGRCSGSLLSRPRVSSAPAGPSAPPSPRPYSWRAAPPSRAPRGQAGPRVRVSASRPASGSLGERCSKL